MSLVGDTSNPTPDGLTPISTSRSKVASGSSFVGQSSAKRLKFNEHGLPVGGEDSAKSSSRLGHLARTHVPICYCAWPKVPERYKIQVWVAYKAEFPEVKESQREIFMKKACDSWKKLKGKLRANLVGNDVTKWKEKVPINVKSEDWEVFCDNEAEESQQVLRRRNKEIKERCPRKTTHNTGRDGYARAAQKWENLHGRKPTRAELWLHTHQKKDKTYAPHDQEFAKKVEMLIKLFQERGEEETLDSGPIYETFGKETRGRVRCIGSTISRKGMLSSAFAREMLTEVDTEHTDWKETTDNLKEEMEGVKSSLAKFINDFESGRFACVGHKINTTPTTCDVMPTSVTRAPSTSQFTSSIDLIPCKILSHTGEIAGYGRKTQLDVVATVHGHRLRPREVRIILDTIKVQTYSLWGGTQGGCSTLADVGIGGFMYWHDDFLPPLDEE